MRHTLTIFFTALAMLACAQSTKKALFLGNSYTYVNNLPELTANIALSTGDVLIYDSNAPGGHTFQNHYGNTVSKNKIIAGGWDYVVLQEQSQLPSFPDAEVEADVYPYAALLDSMVEQYNPCAKTMFYMTWGRKNGDASNCAFWPPVCTYSGMDSLLSLRYSTMANNNQAELSPVGAVWNYIRENYPAIELYQADESHPSAAGSYAAGCCFYTAIFKKDPTLVTYNFTLSAGEAANIRAAVKAVVYNNLLSWNIGLFAPNADFTYLVTANNVAFTNTSDNTGVYTWIFGDGNTSTATNPVHTYAAPGTYTVQLIANSGCSDADTLTQNVAITVMGIRPLEDLAGKITLSPNPSNGSAFDLQLENGDKNVQVIVTDVTGRHWLNADYKLPVNQKVLTVTCTRHLPAGTYLVTIRGDHNACTKKLVVQ